MCDPFSISGEIFQSPTFFGFFFLLMYLSFSRLLSFPVILICLWPAAVARYICWFLFIEDIIVLLLLF